MVHSAGVLVRERGVHGVGLREIVAHAGGPRGSLQRYFPGGKTQLVAEALDLAGADLAADTEPKLSEARTLAAAIDAVIAPWRQLLLDSDFTLGCPIAATSTTHRYFSPRSKARSSWPERNAAPHRSTRCNASSRPR